VGGVRGERPQQGVGGGSGEPIVSGRQIRKPFRKAVLTSPLGSEPGSEPGSELGSAQTGRCALPRPSGRKSLQKSPFRGGVLSN